MYVISIEILSLPMAAATPESCFMYEGSENELFSLRLRVRVVQPATAGVPSSLGQHMPMVDAPTARRDASPEFGKAKEQLSTSTARLD